jgi:hypothetical protein
LERNICALEKKQNPHLEIQKITEYAKIMKWPILSIPGLVVDNRLVSAGKIPSDQQLLEWLNPA